MYSAIIVAAGSGTRAGLGYNKIFYEIKSKKLLEYSVEKFLNDEEFTEIIIVVSKEDLQKARSILKNPKIKYVIGGSTRQKSVFNGLSLANEPFVFIHDSARPNLTIEDIQKLKESLKNEKPAVLYTKAKDSIVEFSEDVINHYINRDVVGLIQTPQAFKTDLIKRAHSSAIKNKRNYTDDASLYRNELNNEVYLVEGNELNFKVTTKLDLMLLEELL